MLSVFGDESHDSTRQRVFVVAGLLGDDRQWDSVRVAWSERTGGKVFHAADCESGYGEYRGIEEEDRHRLHRSLTRVLADSGLIGWGAAIDLDGCRHEFPDMLADQPYGHAFLRTVLYLAEKASQCIPQDSVEFTFDQHPETEYNTSLLYQYLNSQDVYPLLKEGISFASRRTEIGIQLADLWAREMMKRFDGYLFKGTTQPRSQWTTLRSSNRFGGDFICAEYFQDLKRKMYNLQEQLGMTRGKYLEWLAEKRRQDNQSNRILYMMQVDAEERKNSQGVVQE